MGNASSADAYVHSDAPPSVEEALAVSREIGGWLTDEQARVLFESARALPPGARIVEIGSHHGRSTVVLALGAADEVDIVAIDPFTRPERPTSEPRTDIDVGDEDLHVFRANLARAGVTNRVRHLRLSSQDAARAEGGSFDLLFVDGDHSLSGARFDVRNWGARLRPGGTMLVHDAYSSLGVTLAQIVTTFPSARFRYVRRERSLGVYRREDVGRLARLGNAARQLEGLPWFARNVAVKLALRAGLRPVARLLRHDSADDPY